MYDFKSLAKKIDSLSKIKKQFRKLIKSKTPELNISFAWKNVKISSLFTPKTKPIIPKLLITGSLYNHKCF